MYAPFMERLHSIYFRVARLSHSFSSVEQPEVFNAPSLKENWRTYDELSRDWNCGIMSSHVKIILG